MLEMEKGISLIVYSHQSHNLLQRLEKGNIQFTLKAV